jgi:hypothetical protein
MQIGSSVLADFEWEEIKIRAMKKKSGEEIKIRAMKKKSDAEKNWKASKVLEDVTLKKIVHQSEDIK